MASAIRLTKAERAWIRGYAEARPEDKTAQGILDKLEKSELVKGKGTQPGIGWRAAFNAMREVYPGIVAPPNPQVAWMSRMSNRIRDLGITEDNCRTIAGVLKARAFRGRSFPFERAIWQAEVLLADATGSPSKAPARAPSPVEMEDI